MAANNPNSPVALLTDGTKAPHRLPPTDKAFRNLVKDLTGRRPGSEKKVFTKLPKLAAIDTIETVLLYHVIPARR